VKILIVRHGPAGDSAAWKTQGRDDRVRPLTPEGKKEVRQVVTGIARLVPELPLLATSPLDRAKQTAELVAGEYGCKVVHLEALEPERHPEEAVEWLRKQPSGGTVSLVGHEPHLSTLVGYLLTGARASFIDLKKSGACLLAMAVPLQPTKGALAWLLSPRELRQLGK
jgi:phosphohistidine phosphatase